MCSLHSRNFFSSYYFNETVKTVTLKHRRLHSFQSITAPVLKQKENVYFFHLYGQQ